MTPEKLFDYAVVICLILLMGSCTYESVMRDLNRVEKMRQK
jgi:hypothetical protein